MREFAVLGLLLFEVAALVVELPLPQQVLGRDLALEVIELIPSFVINDTSVAAAAALLTPTGALCPTQAA